MPYAEVNGTRLWCEERGSGSPVVFVHSALQDARQWDPQMDAFAERHRAIRYDMRWFGRSDRTTGPFSERDDLRGLLDHLEIDRAALVGSSYGGRVYLEVAIETPERVSALVLVCAGLPGPSSYTSEQTAAVEAAIEAGDLERSVELELDIWAPLGWDGELGRIALENAHVNSDVDAEPAPLEPPAAGRLGEIKAPTLVITGDRDVQRMEELGDQFEREIPDARRIRFAHSDHFPNWREPERFNAVVLDFLAESSG
jgi:3-oxoadipate enol-lactonase